MFTGINTLWVQLGLILVRAVRRGLKRTLRRAQTIYLPKNRDCITMIITLGDTEKIKTGKKMTSKESEEYFFHQCCKKAATNTVMATRF